jgi:signal transduction histidine kinase
LREHSQRLRYEAFSQFASQVNQAVSTEEVGKALARHVKFMLDAFRLRLLHVFEESTTVLELAGGTYTARESPPAESPADNPPAGVHVLEAQLLGTQLPLQLEGAALFEHAALRGGLFDHPKATRFFALPLRLGARHEAVLSVAGKEASSFGVTDFRLMRLMGELLAGKLAQLCLAAKVARRNRQLGEANEELLTLNEQIKRLNLALEQQVEQRTAQLRRANEELATIFYRTSHDFRRPLMTLLGLLNLAEMGARDMAVPADDPAAAGQAVRRGVADALDIYRQGKGVVSELDAMLSKLSTLSGLETAAVRREPVDFAAILAGLRQKFRPELERYGVQLSFDVRVTSPFPGNAGTISVILENLLENAIQFRSAHSVIGVRVYTEAGCAGSDEAPVSNGDEAPPAYVGVDSPAGCSWLVLQTADNGEGIHPAWQDKIFDLYVRASERSKGNGLGLYVVRKLTEGLQGTATVRSEPGQGAVFTVKLPG